MIAWIGSTSVLVGQRKAKDLESLFGGSFLLDIYNMKNIKTYEDFLNERDWNDKKPGRDPYHKGLSDEEIEDKEKQAKKQAKMDDDDPEAYKEMPGDKEAKEKGKVKTSKHVKNYHKLYSEDTDEALADHEDDEADYDKIYRDYPYKPKGKKRRRLVKESRMDSDYLQRMLRTLAQDYKKQGEKDLYKFYDYLEMRLDQSYPSGDVDRSDIEDIMNDSRFRRMNLDVPEWAIDDLFESVVNESRAKGDRGKLDAKVEKALKKKSDETGVPMGPLRIVYRRGAAAWKTGHRPGAGQEQWAYARVNSFLTKQPGTWGGADKDVAKEVRDGGHDKKLKKG